MTDKDKALELTKVIKNALSEKKIEDFKVIDISEISIMLKNMMVILIIV